MEIVFLLFLHFTLLHHIVVNFSAGDFLFFQFVYAFLLADGKMLGYIASRFDIDVLWYVTIPSYVIAEVISFVLMPDFPIEDVSVPVGLVFASLIKNTDLGLSSFGFVNVVMC